MVRYVRWVWTTLLAAREEYRDWPALGALLIIMWLLVSVVLPLFLLYVAFTAFTWWGWIAVALGLAGFNLLVRWVAAGKKVHVER
jgi:hypothetical protein